MGGIDRLIEDALYKEIKEKMNIDVLKKIEHELFLEYGMSIKFSIEHFQKFTTILKKNWDIDVKKIESNCINKVIKIKKIDNNYLLTIVDLRLSDSILELFGDIETRKIISLLLENEYTIPEILKECNIPKTSGYRKIENLVSNGLIVESGKVLSESKKISKFQCIFQEITLDITKGKKVISGIIAHKMFEKSSSMKAIIETLD